MKKMLSNRIIMIGVSNLYKTSLGYTHSSSFPSPFSRHFCTLSSSLVQLSADIDFIYNDLTDKLQFSMSRYQLALIQEKSLSGLYVLSPLRVKRVKKVDLTQFLHDRLPSCPDLMVAASSDPDMVYVLMPDKEDVLVLMGLSHMLFRLSNGGLPKEGYRLSSLVDTHYYSLQQMGMVDRLYKLDLQASLWIIPFSLILDKVKLLVGCL